MKNLSKALALVFVLSISALNAKKSGAFIGVDLGVSDTKITNDLRILLPSYSEQTITTKANFGFRYGLMGGYKWMFSKNFGWRLYLQVNNGSIKLKDIVAPNTYNTLNIMANADLLWNIIANEQNAFGLFAGLSLGYALHSGGYIKDNIDSGYIKDPSGADLGINFGIRTLFAKHHSIELFSRFGMVGSSAKRDVEQNVGGANLGNNETTVLQPYSLGVRYVFNF